MIRNINIFNNELNILNDKNFIIVDNNLETKVKNIFACGDCIEKNVRQITTAIGDAAVASINIALRK